VQEVMLFKKLILIYIIKILYKLYGFDECI